MNEQADLLRRAAADFQTVEILLAQELSDPFQLDIVAYHLQQTVEKLMKHEMTTIGVEFKRVHEIDVLYEQMEENGLEPPKWIWPVAELLTDYAVKTRYQKNLVANKRKLMELVPKVQSYLVDQQNLQKGMLIQ